MASRTRARDGWTRVRFADIAEQVNDRVDDPNAAGVDRYVGLEHLDPSSLRVTRWGAPEEVSAQKLRFHPGDIVFGKRRAYQRKVAVADFEGICSAHAMVLRERPEALASGFLIHFMASDVFMERAVQISVGSLSPTINWSTLRDQEFDLPPMDEQQRFVKVANACAATREYGNTLLCAAMLLHASMRQSCFGLSKSSLPVDTKASPLGEMVEFFDNRRVPLSTAQRSDRKGPYPYYGASGIIDHIDDYLFDEERLLISEDGANLLSRSTPIAFLATGRYWVNNHAHVVQAKAPWTNFLLAEYLEALSIDSHVSGTAQPKLTRGSCEAIRVPALSPAKALIHEKRLRATAKAVAVARLRSEAMWSPSRFFASPES